jgi:hypothetical protein
MKATLLFIDSAKLIFISFAPIRPFIRNPKSGIRN